ncbi:MAG: DNA polymerase III subunits gamma and tau, partial [uncultured Microvirga sp.]
MRLLCVAKDRYPPFRVDIVELFSHRIVGAGWSVDWLMPSGPAADDVVVHSERERFFLILSRSPMRALWQIGGLLWAVLRGRYDLLQARDRPLLALPFLVAARLAGRPFVYWMSFPIVESVERRARDPGETLSPGGRLARLAYARLATVLFYKVVLRWSDRIVVQSPRMLAEVAARGIDPYKMTPVPMGVSTDRHHPARILARSLNCVHGPTYTPCGE